MKKKVKKLKNKINGYLIVKIIKLRKQIKIYKERIAKDVLKEQEYIDKITLLENEIRELKLKGEKWNGKFNFIQIIKGKQI